MIIINSNFGKEVKIFAETFEYEAPQAYKSMDEIKRTILETVEIVDTIKPVYNFKASE